MDHHNEALALPSWNEQAWRDAISEEYPDDSDTLASSDDDFDRFEDAKIVTPIDWEAPALQRIVTVTRAAGIKSKIWSPIDMTAAGVLKLFCRHKESANKDTASLVLGALPRGPREVAAVISMAFVGLDIDTGLATEEMISRIKAAGLAAVLTSTHSHMKPETRVPLDSLVRWCRNNNLGDEPTPAAATQFLLQTKKYDPVFVQNVSVEVLQGRAGREAVISHRPLPRWRVIVPLAEPYVIADNGPTDAEGRARWRAIPEAVARELGGLSIDRTGSDLNRAFHLPSHAPDRPHETYLFGGNPLDWQALEIESGLSTPNGSRSGSRTSTEAGRELAGRFFKRAPGFQIADAVRNHDDEHIRGSRNGSKVTIECPFDSGHSNAGDPNDTACFVTNAGEGPSPIFTISCQHESCRRYTGFDMLAAMIADGRLPEEVLTSDEYNADVAEIAAPPTPQARQDALDAILAQIDHMGAGDIIARDAVVGEIANLAVMSDREVTIKRLSKLTQVSVTVLRREVTARLPKPKEETGAASGTVTTLPNGHRILNYQEAIDQVDCRSFIRQTVLLQNTDEPVWVNNLGQVSRKGQDSAGRVIYEDLRPGAFHAAVSSLASVAQVRKAGAQMIKEAPPREQISDEFEEIARALPPKPTVVRSPTFNETWDRLDRDGHFGDFCVDLGDLIVPEISECLTPEQVADAVSLIQNDLLLDFPFSDELDGAETPDVSKANAIAMLLTPFMRKGIGAVSPIFGIVKPIAGTGATQLANLSSLIFDGEEAETVPYTDNNDEMQKVMLALARAGRGFCFLDNITRLNSPTILRFSTSSSVSGRLLGESDWIRCPNDFLTIFTGISPVVPNEMARRVVWINLDADQEDVRKRTYKHHLKTWVPDHRGELIAALLTMIQYWIQVGRPAFAGAERLPSFEAWVSAVGGVLEVCGITGFLKNPRAIRVDREDAGLRSFAVKWVAAHGDALLTEAKLFQWAAGMGSAIAFTSEGQDEAAFYERLDGLERRVWAIDGQNWKLKRSPDGWRMKLLAAKTQ
ncbi:MAG: hypothetical protein Q8Q88_23935 [Phenylobacterium sp.]|uniref:hypothetical protein n=1 Tax=Phenylobacterium sp. TaxID=1871053 RepID=UPI002733CDE2|nr:hypothetical protein [Phenylobacterium sp.]MDP3750087.1 hypothetical protein [Phenylobacterium sp.]